MNKLTTEERNILFGLKDGGNLYIGASEVAMAMSLRDRGLVEIWSTIGGFSAWRISAAGRERLKE